MMATPTYTPSSYEVLHAIDVDLVKRNRVVEPIHLVQNDKTLPTLAISLYKNGSRYTCPTDSTASIRLEKPDRKVVYMNATGWTQNRDTIYVKTTYQMTSRFGQATAVIEIKSGSSVVQSEPFKILIDRNPIQDSAIESTDEVKDLAGYVDQAKIHSDSAKNYRDQASTFANASKDYAASSKSQAELSKQYADAADTSAESSENFSNEAKESAKKSEDYSNLSKSYAVGTENQTRPNDVEDNAKAYSELARTLTDKANELLKEATKLMEQVKPTGVVTGVKGDKETQYRFGNVNITPEDIGALTLEDLPVQSVKFVGTSQELNDAIASGEVEDGTIAFLTDI